MYSAYSFFFSVVVLAALGIVIVASKKCLISASHMHSRVGSCLISGSLVNTSSHRNRLRVLVSRTVW